jgi:hypothetical protein
MVAPPARAQDRAPLERMKEALEQAQALTDAMAKATDVPWSDTAEQLESASAVFGRYAELVGNAMKPFEYVEIAVRLESGLRCARESSQCLQTTPGEAGCALGLAIGLGDLFHMAAALEEKLPAGFFPLKVQAMLLERTGSYLRFVQARSGLCPDGRDCAGLCKSDRDSNDWACDGLKKSIPPPVCQEHETRYGTGDTHVDLPSEAPSPVQATVHRIGAFSSSWFRTSAEQGQELLKIETALAAMYAQKRLVDEADGVLSFFSKDYEAKKMELGWKVCDAMVALAGFTTRYGPGYADGDTLLLIEELDGVERCPVKNQIMFPLFQLDRAREEAHPDIR